MKTVLCCLWALVILLSCPATLSAQPAPTPAAASATDPCPTGTARDRALCYQREASSANAQNRLDDAIRLFQLAFGQLPRCEYLVNMGTIGITHVTVTSSIEGMRAARDALQRALTDTCRPALTDEYRTFVRARLALAETWLTEHRVTPSPAPTPPAAEAVFRLPRVDYDAYVRDTPVGGDLRRRDLVLLEANQVILPESARADVERLVREGHTRSLPPATRVTRPVPRLSYALWGASVPLLGWGVYSVWAMGDATARGEASGDPGRAERARDAAAISAGLSFAGGAVTGILGTVWYLRRPTRTAPAPLFIVSGTAWQVGVRGTF